MKRITAIFLALALLVCAADRSQDVRAIAEELGRAMEEDS